MKSIQDIPIFFIVGRPRTGTTLLLKMFDAHPNVTIPWECQYIINLYSKYGKIRRWQKKELLSFYHDVMATWQFKFWSIDRERLREDVLACDPGVSYADLCKKVHLAHQSLYPKGDIQYIGDKNPGYTIYVDQLKKIYPDAKFIFINRDYRDNFYSIRNVDFELPVVSVVVYKWKHFFRKALQAKKKYPASVFFLNYEDLAANPSVKFKEVCDFLGIAFREESLEFQKKKEESLQQLKTERSRKHHRSLFEPVDTRRIGLWKNQLTEKEIRIADFVAGHYAERAGYERKFRKARLKTRFRSYPGILYAKMIYILTSIVDIFPYKSRAFILNKGPLMLVKVFMKLRGSD
ncbi:MAG: sulfotransferase [Bacteroidales bacterium]|nr:sulfotransferase [Bacteroidales bacterium]MCF8387427.1 sulfotransferase [Bacteroidales bacterium]MCF8398696.1 sulfotransferase [Bacteroidales bacterium]